MVVVVIGRNSCRRPVWISSSMLDSFVGVFFESEPLVYETSSVFVLNFVTIILTCEVHCLLLVFHVHIYSKSVIHDCARLVE